MSLPIDAQLSNYCGQEFMDELINLMIPDVFQYVWNIVFCLNEANESKGIYCDIINQICGIRKKRQQLCFSIPYKVGKLTIDGRAFANRNFRNWCANMHKISDSILQIVNIVYDLKNNSDKVYYKTTIKKCNNVKLNELWIKLKNLLCIELDVDNKSKHQLNLIANEKFIPRVLDRIDYFIKSKDKIIYVNDLLNDEKEDEIHDSVFQFLDFIFTDAKKRNYPDRAYVEITVDPEVPGERKIELAYILDRSKLNIIKLNIETEKKNEKTSIIKRIEYHVTDKPLDTLYLASLYKCPAYHGENLYKASSYEVDKIDVIRDGIKIGFYKSTHNNDEIGLHFTKYTFCQYSNE